MQYKNILVTGGAGFVGSHICLKLKEHYPNVEITALDNLHRKGSELNIPRLQQHGVNFVKKDVRYREELEESTKAIDLIIECSAEPSVMAGVGGSPEYVIDTNLVGAINCFELARKREADIVFLSTSRIYPVKALNNLAYTEEETRYILQDNQDIPGASKNGISEEFPIDGVRTIYGTTKLSAELMLQEYIENYGIKGIINRCGVISGTWQMGKVDQGVIVFWMAQHIFNKPLAYIGYNGLGKQVRDIVDIDDLFQLLLIELNDMEKYSGATYNVGGGLTNSVSLLELTKHCQRITGNNVPIKRDLETRKGDIRVYLSDCRKIISESGWQPRKSIEESLEEIYRWIIENKNELEHIL